MKLSEKQTQVLGWIATCMSVAMYVAYIPQIMNNLAGNKGDFIQPLVAALNCSLWVYYGLFKYSVSSCKRTRNLLRSSICFNCIILISKTRHSFTYEVVLFFNFPQFPQNQQSMNLVI